MAHRRRGWTGRAHRRASRAPWAAVALALVAAITLIFPAPVAAAASLTLDPTSGARGATVQAIGSEFPTNCAISILWDGVVIKSATSNSTTFVIEFRVPRAATVGPHTVTMAVTSSAPTGCSPSQRDDATFTVVLNATPSPSPTPLPTTAPTPTVTGSTPAPSGPAATSPPTPSSASTLPQPTFPIEAETSTPEPPRVAAITPAPTPPHQVAAPQGKWPDLWIKAIEVTQGIQDLENRMPLAAGRRTYARVYVGVIGEQTWPNTYGALEARRDGQQIGWTWPENGPINAKLGAGSRVQVDDSLNFRLPAAWLDGEVTLRAFVYSYTVDSVFANEPVWQNNLEDVTVDFRRAQPLTVHLAPLHLHRSYHPDDVERTYDPDLDADLLPPGGSSTERIIRGLYRSHPLAQVNVDLFAAPITPIGHDSGHEFNIGDCETSLVGWFDDGHLELSDWEPLMEEPETVEPEAGAGMEADRTTLAILDRTYTISFWGITDDGRIVVYGNSSGGGPQPLAGTPVFVNGCKPDPPTAAEPNQTLSLYRAFYDWDDEEDLFVGMVHPSLPTVFGGLSTAGTDAVWVKMSDSFGSTYTWWHAGADTLAHEAGHAAGLKHVPCKDDDEDGVPDELAGGDIDPSHPDALTFPNCTLADVDPDGYYGFDVYWTMWDLPGPTVVSNNPDQPAPNKAWPLMSYQNPGWPDPYHYCRLLDLYGVPCDPTDLGIPWSQPNASAGGPLTSPPDPDGSELPPGIGLIGLRGSLDPAAGTGTLQGAFFLGNPTDAALRRYSGQYVIAEAAHAAQLVVLDAAGTELYRVPILDQEHTHDAEPQLEFELLVPAPAEAKTFQVISAGRDVAQLDVSPNAPVVSWEPITQEPDTLGRVKVKFAWAASDADGDRLTYTLLYAPDGEHWQVLAAELRGRTYDVELDTLPGGDTPIFQVIAFDGSHGTSAVSGSIAPVLGLKPEVVLSVGAVDAYPSAAAVLLAASAFDPEDRTLPGDSIAWSSSIDGALGTGSELVVRDLSAGTHTITATVTDSDGLIDAQAFELTIDSSVVQAAADPAVEADVGTIFAAFAAGDDPGAAIAEAPVAPASPLPLLIGAVVLLLAGAGLVVVRKRRVAGAAKRAAEPGAWRRRLQ